MVLANKRLSKRKYFFLEFTNFYLEVCKFEKILPVGTPPDITLKKDHDLQICTRHTCRGILCDGIRKKYIFQPEVFFSPIYKLVKQMVYLEVCKFEKKYFRLEKNVANTIA